jgi:DNA polymerase III subunit gamma/tau
MGQALYRKYRSKSLSEIVGQDHIKRTLEQALKTGKISHAYLLTGPRGVGKTSIARILAHAVNGLQYDEGNNHLDIIEIDAASNRRIDEIRDLRDKVNNAPTQAQYKVYIIDEVHMLTREAFNALLKTLEEPPAHVIFILATTEGHKLPETIISRTQRFTFKPISIEDLVAHLRFIANKEKIEISDEALKLIAEHGQGSFRDSISLLDQVHSGTAAINAETVEQALGIVDSTSLEELILCLGNQDMSGLLKTLQVLKDKGVSAASIASQLGSKVRELLISEEAVLPSAKLLHLLERLLSVPGSPNPGTQLEIVLLETIMEVQSSTSQTQQVVPEKEVPKTTQKNVTAIKEPAASPVKKLEVSSRIEPSQINTSSDPAWPEILKAIKKRHNTLYGIVRMASPRFEDKTLYLAFSFPFHQKRVAESANERMLLDIIKEVTGTSYTLICEALTPEKLKQKVVTKQSAERETLDTISNIFGDAEVLQSGDDGS